MIKKKPSFLQTKCLCTSSVKSRDLLNERSRSNALASINLNQAVLTFLLFLGHFLSSVSRETCD